MNEDKILKKLDDHDARFDGLEHRFNQHDARFDKHEQQMDRMSVAIVQLQGDVEEIKQNMMTQKDKDDIMDKLDALVGHKKTDEIERAALTYRIGRTEDRVRKVEDHLRITHT